MSPMEILKAWKEHLLWLACVNTGEKTRFKCSSILPEKTSATTRIHPGIFFFFFTQSDINVVAEAELGELHAAGRSLKAD